MAVVKRITVRGMNVELWEQSFRVEGMYKAVWVGKHMTDEMVSNMVESVYSHVWNQAREAAREQVAEELTTKMKRLVLGDS